MFWRAVVCILKANLTGLCRIQYESLVQEVGPIVSLQRMTHAHWYQYGQNLDATSCYGCNSLALDAGYRTDKISVADGLRELE